MKRAPIVVAGTVAGLLSVLEFHTTPAKISAGSLPQTPAATAPAGGRGASGTTSSGGNGTAAGGGSGHATAGQSRGQHSAVGPGVNYYYGVVSVKVSVARGKIVNVGIASINDGSNPRSQYIDQQAVPILEQEVIKAQSANIQGVSGASYTSAGFDQSLQKALHQLGFA